MKFSTDDMREQRICQNSMGCMREMRHAAFRCLALLLAGWLFASGAGPAAAQIRADEDRDWGVTPSTRLRQPPYSAPTPAVIPGAGVLATRSLKDMLDTGAAPILIDVASGDGHKTLPGAYWLPGAGRGANFIDDIQGSLAALLDKLTRGDKQRPLVFFCVNTRCWLSYNAALRAAAAGYGRVWWYRGGIEAWRAAGLPLVDMAPARAP